MKTILKIKGMHCESCKFVIEDICKDFMGVKSCEADFKEGRAVLEHDGMLDCEMLCKEINDLKEYTVLTTEQI